MEKILEKYERCSYAERPLATNADSDLQVKTNVSDFHFSCLLFLLITKFNFNLCLKVCYFLEHSYCSQKKKKKKKEPTVNVNLVVLGSRMS